MLDTIKLSRFSEHQQVIGSLGSFETFLKEAVLRYYATALTLL